MAPDQTKAWVGMCVKLSTIVAFFVLWMAVLGAAVGEAADGSLVYDRLLEDYARIDTHVTLGLDEVGVGLSARDAALGYPRKLVGVNGLFGVTWRVYAGQPSTLEVAQLAQSVMAHSPDIDAHTLRVAIKARLDRKWLRYVGFNTAFLVVPGIEGGFTYDAADVDGSGFAFDAGLLWGFDTLLLPIPVLGVQYTF